MPAAPLIADERFINREPSFGAIAPEALRLDVCADERRMSAASRQRLAEHFNIDPAQRYNRDFGGIHGDAHDVAAVMAAQGGKEVLASYAGNFKGFVADTKQTIAADAQLGMQEGRGGLVPVDHSDDHNEHTAESLNLEAEGGLGCAFDKLFGTVMALEATNAEIQAEARAEYMQDVDADPVVFDQALQGVKDAFEVLLGGNANYSVTREDVAAVADLASDGKPLAAVLEGDHFGVDDVVEIANYAPNSGAEPDDNAPAFVTDMTDKTYFTARAYARQGVNLDPKYMFAVKILKRATVRFALSGQQANRMAHTARGNAQEALNRINQQLAAA
ncbi:MAG TPA: hypothetical protein VL737_02375 [Candidatus Pristimantibacillus sp.]|jgi:hypothetical protein|nr:hypothetical protein [Candidatus Pristimantibacillus sp.]